MAFDASYQAPQVPGGYVSMQDAQAKALTLRNAVQQAGLQRQLGAQQLQEGALGIQGEAAANRRREGARSGDEFRADASLMSGRHARFQQGGGDAASRRFRAWGTSSPGVQQKKAV